MLKSLWLGIKIQIFVFTSLFVILLMALPLRSGCTQGGHKEVKEERSYPPFLSTEGNERGVSYGVGKHRCSGEGMTRHILGLVWKSVRKMNEIIY